MFIFENEITHSLNIPLLTYFGVCQMAYANMWYKYERTTIYLNR